MRVVVCSKNLDLESMSGAACGFPEDRDQALRAFAALPGEGLKDDVRLRTLGA